MNPRPNGLTPDADVRDIGDALKALLGLFTLNGAGLAGPVELITQGSLRKYVPNMPTIAEMNEAWRRGQVPEDIYRKVMNSYGFGNRATGIIEATRGALLDVNALQEMRRRGLILDGQYNEGLSKLGYDETQRENIAGLRLYIPSAQDVVMFANRDVYYPDVVATYGMDKDFPDAMLPDMERAGLDKDTALKFWESHWALPSMQQAFEMLQRDAETGLTTADINRLMRSAGVEPYWRDKLLAISYSPFTRVDIRRMHKAGVLDRAAVVRSYRDIGYNAQRAEQLTVFTEKLNKAADNEELAPFRTKFRTHAESLYLDGVISEAELHAQFKTLEFTDEEASAFVSEAEFVKHAAARRVVRESVKGAYTTGHLTDEAARARLVTDGYTDAQAVEILAPWHVVREMRALTVHEHAERDLTKSEIVTAYIEALMTGDEARAALQSLKYDEHEIDMLIKLADYRKHQADRKSAETVQHSLFMARRIDRAQAARGLVEAGVDPARIEHLTALWADELAARTPSLSKAEVAHAIVQEFIDQDEGVRRLLAMGYARSDVTIIVELASKGLVVV